MNRRNALKTMFGAMGAALLGFLPKRRGIAVCWPKEDPAREMVIPVVLDMEAWRKHVHLRLLPDAWRLGSVDIQPVNADTAVVRCGYVRGLKS